MKAAWYERTGSASDVLQIGELPDPTVGPADVLVRVRASGVNPSDVKARAGLRGGSSGMPYPLIVPHSDGAGVIEAVGSSVTDRHVGQRVFIWNAQWDRAHGSAAEHVAIPSAQTAPLPDKADFAVGATLGIPGFTAAHCVRSDGEIEGQTVLVHGGAGSVGYLMVQLACASGAKVVATIGNDSDAERVIAAGAAAVANYKSPTLLEELRAHGDSGLYDRIIDVEFGANIDVNAELIKPHRKLVGYGSQKVLRPEIPFYPLMFKGVRIDLVLIYLLGADDRKRAIEVLTTALANGTLNSPIHARYPLEQIAVAHEAVEAGRREGAVIVEP